MMKPVRHRIGKLALILTLAVAVSLVPSSQAHARQGHGGGHAGRGGSGHFAHRHYQPYAVGFGGTWGGYDPYWGYGSFYGGGYGYGYGAYGGNIGPYFGGYTPFWGGSPANTSTNYNFVNSIDLFR
jgi:hypothetical protein